MCIYAKMKKMGFTASTKKDINMHGMFTLEPKQILQPLLFRDSHFVFAHDFLAESLDKPTRIGRWGIDSEKKTDHPEL